MIKSRLSSLLLFVSFLLIVSIETIDAAESSPEIVSAMILKLLPMENNLMKAEGEFKIHVVGSHALADALKKVVGWQIGKRVLGNVTVSDGLPSEKTDVICITDKSKLKEIIEYTREENILSVTNDLKLVKKGVSLGVGVKGDGKPSVKLNLTSSKKEKLNWNYAVFKFVKTIK